MAVEDLVQAVREGLSNFLKAQLAAAYPTLAVYQDWPTKNQRGDFTVTVLVAGEPECMRHPPVVISSTPDVSPATTGGVVYSFGRCEDLPLQLDCWARSEFARDNLARDLRAVLNQPPSVTLATGTPDALGVDAGLVLAIAGLAGQPVEYDFTPVQTLPEDSDSAEKNEWRASWRGSARFSLVGQKSGVQLIKRIVLQIGASELRLHTTPRETRDVATITLSAPATIALTRPDAQRPVIIATFQGGMTADVTKICAFSTDAPQVAAVDADGLVRTGYKAGTAHITVAYAGQSAVITVTVS